MRPYLLAVLLIAGPALAISDDLENSFQQLREAQTSGDVALIKKLATETCALARKQAEEPAPDNEAGKDWRTKHLAYLREIEGHTEYALYTAALKAKPAETIDLIQTLEAQNPKSRYLDPGYAAYFAALTQTGQSAKILGIAAQAVKNLPDNEDLLLILADAAINGKQYDRALTYAERSIAVLSRHAKPDWIGAADWERRRNTSMGRSRFIAGVAHSEKAQPGEADKDLRAALPLIEGNEAMLASTLFYLGLANYQIGASIYDKARVLEAAKFSDRAAAIKGPLSTQAWRNAQAMRDAAQKLR
jgi:tetratricopeptide (TPR) repeat protein